jgi:secondary thiamine-phosphate synthase enzyme
MEGPDDSPSHMKSILLQHSLSLLVEKSELFLGQWQGVYLCEFRDSPKKRNIILKFMPDQI